MRRPYQPVAHQPAERSTKPPSQGNEKNAAIFYDGPSQFTGERIVAVLTGLQTPSNNTKTGDMLQVYIIRPDVDPTMAIVTGADNAICGDCRLRGNGVQGRGCFVIWWQAPLKIWSQLHHRPFVDPWTLRHKLRGRMTRIGAYGDPAAVPVEVWAKLLSKAGGWVGYTQQWATCDSGYKFFLMASVHNPEEQAAATALGWRTYRIRLPQDPILAGEVICPASEEAGHKLQCVDCRICMGANSGRANAAIVAHGKPGSLAVFGLKPKPRKKKLAQAPTIVHPEPPLLRAKFFPMADLRPRLRKVGQP